MGIAKNRVLELVQDGGLRDEQLVARVCAGDTALFEVLMRRHNQRVYRAVRAIIRDEAEAEEIMQQAYVSAFTHLNQFQGTARFSTWLVKIAVNEALARKRRGARLVALDGGADSEELMSTSGRPPADPERDASAREFALLIEGAVDELSDLYRTVFMLREVEGMGTADAADVLGVSEDVVKTRLHRAKALVREKLEARIGAGTSEAFPFHDSRCDRVVAGVLSRIQRG
jgi:RNA polymerase sigma-70 factor (ECF subfamily)